MAILTVAGGKKVFHEGLYPHIAQQIEVSEVLFPKTREDRRRIGPQKIMVLKTPQYGNMLAIDDVVQTTEEIDDESAYHESLVHLAVNSCIRTPRTALLIGCDGGTLREVVKYGCFEKIVVVDIDRTVIDIVKRFLPSIPNGAWEDPRVSLVIADGAKYATEARRQRKQFDVIIVDSPDPIGPASSLFKRTFYLDIAKVLSPDGVVIRQTGSSVFQPDEMPSNFRLMHEIFDTGDVRAFITSVPTYIGGYFTLVAASPKKDNFKKSLHGLRRRFERRMKRQHRESLYWYDTKMHVAAMVLPKGLRKTLEQSEWGREVIIDLYGCDYGIISSTEKLREFASKLCDVIKMKPFGDPIIPDFGHAKSRTAGPSLVQLIETSAIVAHYSTHWGLVVINIFTCATLEAEEAVRFCIKFLGAEKASWRLLVRGRRFMSTEETLDTFVTVRDGRSFTTSAQHYQLDTKKTRKKRA